MPREEYDVIVVGVGNAAMCAAMSAHESGAKKVVMLERASEDEAGGNSRFTAGSVRFAHNGLEDILTLVELSNEERENNDFGTYTTDQFYDDMFRVTQYRTDPELCEILVTKSLETVQWLRSKGVRFVPNGEQCFKVGGKMKFWGGLALEFWGGGPGIWEMESKIVGDLGIPIAFEHRVVSLLYDEEKVYGVRVKHEGKVFEMTAKSVVLACGGFEANSEWRTRYLGPGWDLAKVRGTRHNMGDGIRMALDIGAMPYGNWAGCHAVGWDLNAPEFGDLVVGTNFQKHSYPFGILVNADGKRFVDEGADFRNYTYAKYGREILNQPGQFAWQIFDQKVVDLWRAEYRIKQLTKVTDDTIEGLAAKLEGVNAEQFVKTIAEFNDAVMDEVTFNPAVLDGRGTRGLGLPKSNWATKLDTPPFEAFAVTCGVTFTFGGLRINRNGQVLDTDLRPIPGLYAAGELVGGIFYFNYPGGTGLINGSVFGRIAGASTAKGV